MATIYDITTQPQGWLGGARRNDIIEVGRQCFVAMRTIGSGAHLDEEFLQAASSAMTKIVRDACALGLVPGEFIESAKLVLAKDRHRHDPRGLELTILGVDEATSEALWSGWCDAMDTNRKSVRMDANCTIVEP